MSERTRLLERLDEVHCFPDTYTFKVIGDNSKAFVDQVVDQVEAVVGADATPAVSTRESSAGNHLSVTVSVEVADAQSVVDVYDRFDDIDQVRIIL